MRAEKTDRILNIIHRKWKKLSETDNEQLYRHFKRLWEFIHTNSLSNEILQKILQKFPHAEMDAHNILNQRWTYYEDKTGGEERDIAAFIKVIDILTGPNRTWEDMYQLALDYVGPSQNDQHYYLNCFYSLFLTPILEYVQDHLEENILILDTLKRFKERCEWFDKKEILNAFESDTNKGEYHLKKFLFRYLFDEGIPFVIEPSSPSGEIDFIASQTSSEKICAEVKIFDPDRSKGKTQILKGIETQLLGYLNDYNEPIGYMVIFKTGSVALHLNLDTEQKINFIMIGSKRIYVCVIDIFNYTKSSSVRETAKSETISKEDFLR